MPREQFSSNFNKEERALGKESLQEEYRRLTREVAELNKELTEQQKEFRGENAPTADFYAAHALVEYKNKRLKEIEAQLREK
jgi:glutathione S-transferase